MSIFGIVAVSIICAIAFLFVSYGALRLINTARRRSIMNNADSSSMRSWKFLKNPFARSGKFDALDADDMWDSRVEETELSTIPSAANYFENATERSPFVTTELSSQRDSSPVSHEKNSESEAFTSPFHPQNAPFSQNKAI
ncbi:hypothetical protein SPOG_00154 [Schizosaccharomyces cryophilus OY26]|uniref:Uncharacterized protein n=1 Tax=Schizosaccharomyces cryophilus (strain OY26 / ATCC MYA-4695 / CBS 11777 / NBRC 106824 / NRRL Y48691) TaxID=653667 RepID=S9VZQ3_SCHCR|nr:uncharacterized protein SPOG_00154 [Schizosaccharomyces cryophilus OY26]EPY51729.1 hypothetical protein SPOG_00154 [Schizosaccharomyces cryophilus OY26]